MIVRSKTQQFVVDRQHTVRLQEDVILTDGKGALGMMRLFDPSRKRLGAVLLIHGFAQNHHTWHLSQRSFAASLAERGWDVFMVDLRGRGLSRRFDDAQPHDLDDFVNEDIPRCAVAIRALGYERFSLLGHSMGGLVAYAVASSGLRHMISCVITLGSPFDFGAGSNLMTGLATLSRLLRFTGAFEANPKLPFRSVGRHLLRVRVLFDKGLVPFRPWRPGSMKKSLLSEYLTRTFDLSRLSVAFQVFEGGDRNVMRSRDGEIDYGLAFETLDLPIQAIAGSYDDLAPPKSVKAAIDRSRSSHKQYRVFPHGHADLTMGDDAPLTVWPAVQSFLEKHGVSN